MKDVRSEENKYFKLNNFWTLNGIYKQDAFTNFQRQ
jgi:hypothetical protein